MQSSIEPIFKRSSRFYKDRVDFCSHPIDVMKIESIIVSIESIFIHAYAIEILKQTAHHNNYKNFSTMSRQLSMGTLSYPDSVRPTHCSTVILHTDITTVDCKGKAGY